MAELAEGLDFGLEAGAETLFRARAAESSLTAAGSPVSRWTAS